MQQDDRLVAGVARLGVMDSGSGRELDRRKSQVGRHEVYAATRPSSAAGGTRS